MYKRKRFVIFGLFVLIVFGVLYLESNVILGFLADKAIQRIKPKLAQHGVHVGSAHFARVEMRSLRRCVISDLDVHFHMEAKEIEPSIFLPRSRQEKSPSAYIRFGSQLYPFRSKASRFPC